MEMEREWAGRKELGKVHGGSQSDIMKPMSACNNAGMISIVSTEWVKCTHV